MIAATFWALIAIFVVIAGMFFIPVVRELFKGPQFLLPFIIFSILGVVLLFLAVKSKAETRLKKFLILTGASAVGVFISILLHNLIYGSFIQLFGLNFWEKIGLGDEPIFFFLAILVCPIGFLVGAVGSAVLLLSKKSKERR